MKKIFLARFDGSDHGTKGIWITRGFRCRTIELPWKNNKSNYSCIPDGVYPMEIHHSRKYGKVYQIKDVFGRTWILAHNGNFAGDVEKGFRTHSKGCILLGKYHGVIHGQNAVCLSKTTLRRFMDFMQDKPAELEVRTIYYKEAT